MRNKFEALDAFKSWPEDWQRLCAEYWAESDKPNDSHQAERFDPDAVAKIASSVKAVEECKSDRFEPKKRNDSCGLRWTPAETELLLRCVEVRDSNADGIRMFLLRNKNRRTFRSAEQRLQFIRNNPSKLYK